MSVVLWGSSGCCVCDSGGGGGVGSSGLCDSGGGGGLGRSSSVRVVCVCVVIVEVVVVGWCMSFFAEVPPENFDRSKD